MKSGKTKKKSRKLSTKHTFKSSDDVSDRVCKLVSQDQDWMNKRLDELDTPHLGNIIAWLLRNADSIHGAMSKRPYADPPDEFDASLWILRTPLMQRVVELFYTRGDLDPDRR